MAKNSPVNMTGENGINQSGTMAWLIYQLYDIWMQNLRNSFYLSTDLGPLAPVFDDPLTYEEAVEKFDQHMAATEETRNEMGMKYTEGIQILGKVMEAVAIPPEKRGDLHLGKRRVRGGKIEEKIKTEEEMYSEMEDIIARYERGEDVSALDIALKNAYAMYFGLRPFDEENLKCEKYILEQVLTSVNKALPVMGAILRMVPRLEADYVYEMKSKGSSMFDNKSKAEIDRMFFNDVGGLIRPFVGSIGHYEELERARRANYKGMGTSTNRYMGGMETPQFTFTTPAIHSAPGAGKNSIIEQMAEEVNVNLDVQNMPLTTEADNSMSAYNPKSGTVSSSLTGNAWATGVDIVARLADEFLRLNREGRTGIENLQDYMLHRTISPQNGRYKGHPGTLLVFATNTDKNSRFNETEIMGRANRDRVVAFEVTEEMSISGRERYLRGKFGKKLTPGTPLHAFYEFFVSTDQKLGAWPLLNKSDIAVMSNYKDLNTQAPTGRPVTQELEVLFKEHEKNVTMERIERHITNIGGQSMAARFRIFAKISNSLPSKDEMLKAAGDISNIVVSIASFDINFRDCDRESGKFKIDKNDVSPELIYRINRGNGLPKEIVEKIKNSPDNYLKTDKDTKVEKPVYADMARKSTIKIETGCKNAKTQEQKKIYESYMKKAKESLDFIEKLDRDKLAAEVEKGVNSIFVMKNTAENAVPNGLNEPIVQKMIADRIITSFESYVDSCYNGNLNEDRKPRPLDEDVLKKYMTLVFMCPFANQRDNMLSQMKNILVDTPSETVVRGMAEHGFKPSGGNTPVTTDTVTKELAKNFGKNMASNVLAKELFFYKLPVLRHAMDYSSNLLSFIGDRNIGTIDEVAI